MTFAHPGLLGLAALASGPVVIHLLAARSAPVEPWAAVRFLTADSPARRRSALRDRLVLILRTLAVLLAALAAAGPRGDGAGLAAESPAALTVAVLDGSLSMTPPRGGATAFAEATRALDALAAAAGPADRFVLVRTAEADPTAGPPRGSGLFGAAEFRRVLRDAGATNAAGDVPAALAAAAEAVREEADRFNTVRAVIATDRAAADWGGPAAADALERLTAALPAGPPRFVGPPGPGPAGRTVADLAVSAGDPDPRLDAIPRAGEPAELVAVVRTFGAAPAGSVAFFVNERFAGRAAIPAAAGADGPGPTDAVVRLPFVFAEPGAARAEARLEDHPGPPALAGRFLAVPVRGPLRVLLLADPAADGDPGFYLDRALSAEPGTFAPVRAPFADLPRFDPAAFDAVVTAGAPPPPFAAALRDWLTAGGGAVVTVRPGDDLGPLLTGPLGGLIAGPAVGGGGAAFPFDFAPNGDGNPLAALAGAGGEANGFVLGYRRVQRSEEPPADAWPAFVAARFGDGEPAILTAVGPRGGRLALLTTEADAGGWGGGWPAAGANFAPLVRTLVAFAAAPPPPPSATTGEPLTFAMPPGRFARSATVAGPDGGESVVPVAGGTATFAAAMAPGFYTFAPPGGGIVTAAVNAPASEADPRTADLPETDDVAEQSTAAATGPRPLTGWVWAAALGLLLIEPLAGRAAGSGRFSRFFFRRRVVPNAGAAQTP